MPSTVFVTAVMGLLGLIVGSFLAAVSVRLPRDEDIVFARSRCMSCERPLAARHMVPVFSWLVLRGRCGWCRAAISPRYLLIELAAGGIGLWAALTMAGRPDASWLTVGATAVLGWQLLLIALIDAEHFWLPDALTWPLAGTGLAVTGLMAGGAPWPQIAGVAVGFGLLWLIAAAYRRVRGREGLGGGDPFLMGAIGGWVGWTGLPSVMIWACAGGFSLVLARMILRKAVSGEDRLPFGTFLALGAWMVWLLGPIGL